MEKKNTEAAAPPPSNTPAPVAPVAEDTTRDAAAHATGTKMDVVLTALQGVSPLQNGTEATAKFAGTEATCTLDLQNPIAAGQGSEGSMICKQALHLSGGAFEFSLHANGLHIADGVVLQ